VQTSGGLNTGHAATSHFPDRCPVFLFVQVGKILTAEGDMLMLDSHPLLPVMTSIPPPAPEPAVTSYKPVGHNGAHSMVGLGWLPLGYKIGCHTMTMQES